LTPGQAMLVKDETFLIESAVSDCLMNLTDGEFLHAMNVGCHARWVRIRQSVRRSLGF
jgi:hypothetical protein